MFFPGHRLHVFPNPKHWQEGPQQQAEGPDNCSQSQRNLYNPGKVGFKSLSQPPCLGTWLELRGIGLPSG